MTPRFAKHDLFDSEITHLELPSQPLVRTAKFMQGAYQAYLMIFQLGVAVLFAHQKSAAPLYHHVAVIVTGSTEEKMVGANTATIVAFVAHVKTVWNRPDMQHVAHAMRKLIPSEVEKSTISLGAGGSNPDPTIAGFFDVLEKPQPRIHAGDNSGVMNT